MSKAVRYDAIYIRVSDESELDIQRNQLDAAERYEHNRGRPYVVFMDVASGKDTARNAYNRLMEKVRAREIETVVFTSLSRMTRGGVKAAFEILGELERYGTGWHFVEMPVLNFDASTPKMVKDIILAVLAAVDEDYRRNISEKTKAALARRKALGVKLGRPKKRLPQ